MPLYVYVKSHKKNPFRYPPMVSFIFIGLGVGLLLWVLWPIASFQLSALKFYTKTISPIEDGMFATNSLPSTVLAVGNDLGEGENMRDYTNPNIWFPTKPQRKTDQQIRTYKLSIPKLRIFDALVIVGGDSLEKSLIHYGGTANPGEYGNTVIFGHSTLPQLYDPNNYKTIFSLLPTLKPASDKYKGDTFFINYDGIAYKYLIYDMIVKDPEDLSELEQRFDDSYVTLVTCVPPGTYWKRLYVKAKVVPL